MNRARGQAPPSPAAARRLGVIAWRQAVMAAAVGGLGLAVACGPTTGGTIDEEARMTHNEATRATAAEPGASVSLEPSEALRAWFEAHAHDDDERRRTFRVPAAITRSPLGVQRAHLATAVGEDDALAVALDDTTLGVSLDVRLRRACGDAATTCVVWLEGYWGAPVSPGSGPDGEGPTGDGAPHPFTVRAVGPRVAPGEAPRAYVVR